MKSHCPYDKPIVFEKKCERFHSVWPSFFKSGIMGNPKEKVWMAYVQARDMFIYSYQLDKSTHDELIHTYGLAKQAAVAHFRLITNADREISFTIDNQSFKLLGFENSYNVGLSAWIESISSAIILRDWKAVEVLCKFSVNLMKRDGLGIDEFDEALLEMIKGVFDPGADMLNLVRLVMDKSEPKYIDKRRQGFVYDILMPFANVLVAIMGKDGEEHYRNTLEKAVQRHVSYWNVGELKYNCRGWVSLPLIAAAVPGYTQKKYRCSGLEPYIPDWLVIGDFTMPPSVSIDFSKGEV